VPKPSLERILLVEDEPDIQAITRVALEMIGGFKLEVCNSGVEALQKAPEFAPDLILLDVMMPVMDGPGTLAALRNLTQTATTPVIFMTAKVHPSEVAEYIKLGALDVIAKPFDPMHLASNIKTIWSAVYE
jgi:two-component system OmpR family response regulator